MNKLRQMQAVSKRMYKDMRKCNDTETAWMRCGQRMVSDIKSSALGRSEPLKHTAESLNGVMEELHAHSKTLKTNQEITFSDPIKKFNGVYKHVEFHSKQRELKQQEYDKQQAKLDKQGRKTTQPQQPGAQAKLDLLQRSLASAKADYERVHGRLMHDMPKLYDNRLAYFDHCLQAVIKAQALYYHDSSDSLYKVACSMQKELGHTEDGELMTEEQIMKTNDKYLDEIRGLSIVGTSPVS